MNPIFDLFGKAITDVAYLLKTPHIDMLKAKAVNALPRLYLQSNCSAKEPRDTVVVIDVSGSMDSRDYPPTRLAGGIEAAIEYINTRAEQSPDDKTAVIAFHDRARIVLPLTRIAKKERIIKAIRQLKIDGGTDIAKGLQAAICIFDEEPKSKYLRQIILLTDGHGGKPLRKATKLKEQYGAVIDVVGIGGNPEAVKESLLRKVATTDTKGSNHYRFIKDSKTLKKHYRQLATGLVWHGEHK